MSVTQSRMSLIKQSAVNHVASSYQSKNVDQKKIKNQRKDYKIWIIAIGSSISILTIFGFLYCMGCISKFQINVLDAKSKDDESKYGESKDDESKYGESKHGKSINDEAIQYESIKSESKPGELVHGESINDESIDHESIPHKSGYGKSKPGESKPGELKHGELKNGESINGESTDDESILDESEYGESKPGELKHGELKYGESINDKSIDDESIQHESAHGELIYRESQRGELKHKESEHGESKPGELKPGELTYGESINDKSIDNESIQHESAHGESIHRESQRGELKHKESKPGESVNDKSIDNESIHQESRGELKHKESQHGESIEVKENPKELPSHNPIESNLTVDSKVNGLQVMEYIGNEGKIKKLLIVKAVNIKFSDLEIVKDTTLNDKLTSALERLHIYNQKRLINIVKNKLLSVMDRVLEEHHTSTEYTNKLIDYKSLEENQLSKLFDTINFENARNTTDNEKQKSRQNSIENLLIAYYKKLGVFFSKNFDVNYLEKLSVEEVHELMQKLYENSKEIDVREVIGPSLLMQCPFNSLVINELWFKICNIWQYELSQKYIKLSELSRQRSLTRDDVDKYICDPIPAHWLPKIETVDEYIRAKLTLVERMMTNLHPSKVVPDNILPT